MATRVSCPHNGWYVLESVDEIEALIEPPAPSDDDEGLYRWQTIRVPPRFVSLTIDPAYMGNRRERKIRVAVNQIIALEEITTHD